MPAVTDLTWAQLERAHDGSWLKQINVNADQNAPNPTFHWVLDIGAVLGQPVTDINAEQGVVKVLIRLLATARAAQEVANTGKATGEKLAAFAAPTTGTPNNGTVPITYSVAGRALLSSATQIVGANV